VNRRRWLAAGCAQCATLYAGGVLAQRPEPDPLPTAPWRSPQRFARPDLASDEGGLWAMMDREETRLRRSPFAIRDAALREYVQGIACRLSAEHCPDVRVHAVRTPFFNASMAPNGMMQVWSGLLLRMENEAQLAAVLGHEIGHYLQRHTLDRLRDAKARSAFATFMAAFGVVGLVGQLATLASAFSFTRDQEREADSIGLALMRDAGYDPRECGKVWDNLRAEAAAAPGADEAGKSPMFATHPPSDERSQTLARLAAGANGGFLGEAEYAARLEPFRFGLLEDEIKRGQYDETLVLLARMLKRAPVQADLLYVRGEAYRLRGKDGDVDAALADLRRASAVDKAPPQLYRSLGYLHQRQGQAEEARTAFSRYLELMPEAPDAGLIRTYLPEGKS
jgi:predicted Zn-dependent protease